MKHAELWQNYEKVAVLVNAFLKGRLEVDMAQVTDFLANRPEVDDKQDFAPVLLSIVKEYLGFLRQQALSRSMQFVIGAAGIPCYGAKNRCVYCGKVYGKEDYPTKCECGKNFWEHVQ